MKKICDYSIIQRDPDGFGRGVFAGSRELSENAVVMARVMREDDNRTVVAWQRCSVEKNEWHIELTIPQGGLYRIEARLTAAEVSPNNNAYDWGELIGCISHVGVGDIFILAGQSNMSGYGKDPAFDPPQLGVHLFNNAGEWTLASHPLGSVASPVYRNNDPASGTSPGLSFGKMMMRELGVPIGLVSASLGGSSLESWNPAEKDCFLYDEMVRKAEAVGNFAGMLWYQGCNETNEEEAGTYYEKFCEAIGLWREKFGHFSIALCQLNRHSYKESGDDRYWGLVREAQRRAALDLTDVFIVPTLDLFTSDGIHNSSGANIIIGERLAEVMLKGKYGKPGSFAPNVVKITRTDPRRILLRFRDPHMLRTMDDIATGLNIEDEEGLAECTKISVCDDGAIVTCERDIGENAVFHAYWRREEPAFFLRDIYGMPMLACYGVPVE